jgi:gamma-glutamyltranspeptidase / glutathione hydrolase
MRAFASLIAFVPVANICLAVSSPPDVGTHVMVVTAQHYGTDAGYDILKRGGNAIDAAVAIGYALAVVHPAAGNLGGGGFMTIHLANGKNTFINFREKAPLRATPNMYLDSQGNVIPGLSTSGYLAVGVPGSPAGLEYARQHYGSLSREVLLAAAIKLAQTGFILEQGDVDILSRETSKFRTQPNIAAIFLKNGQPYGVGDRLIQRNLAATLRQLSHDGPSVFYRGAIADKIIAVSNANGGILSKEDFAQYTVAEQKPIVESYRGFDIISSPPPSSGGTCLCEILNILSGYPMGEYGYHSAKSVHFMVEAMRHAYVDRTVLGDPDFVQNPLDHILSASHAAEIRGAIDPVKATPSKDLASGNPPHEGIHTTHYSVIDRYGNAVAVTYTINSYFGANRIAGDTGFLLNNEMDDFAAKPGVPNQYGLVQGAQNAIASAKRPLSSMSPTIVLKQGTPFLVTGSPGGPHIITITLETIMNVIDYNLDIQSAVDAPRIHHQWLPDVVYLEPYALSADTQSALEQAGYHFSVQWPWGSSQSIEIPDQDLHTGPVEAPGQSPVGSTLLKGLRYGGWDHRSPAGSARGEESDRLSVPLLNQGD